MSQSQNDFGKFFSALFFFFEGWGLWFEFIEITQSAASEGINNSTSSQAFCPHQVMEPS